MKLTIRLHRLQRLALAATAAAAVIIPAGSARSRRANTNPATGSNARRLVPDASWSKGTIVPFQKGDFPSGMDPDGSWYRFKADSNKVEYPCKPEFIRPIGGVAAPKTPAEPASVDNPIKQEMPAAGRFLGCPVEQKQVKDGLSPDPELFKKIIRCKKGEKAVDEGSEGAVGVDISALQIGSSRPDGDTARILEMAKPGLSSIR